MLPEGREYDCPDLSSWVLINIQAAGGPWMAQWVKQLTPAFGSEVPLELLLLVLELPLEIHI